MKFNQPRYDWVLAQAQELSSRKDPESVGALAWNLTVAFRRWLDAQEPICPSPEEVSRS